MTVSTSELARVLSAEILIPHGSSKAQAVAAEVIDATHDSRQVSDGFAYFCVPGANVDGHDFAIQAVDSGASALVVDRPLTDPGLAVVPQLLVNDVRSSLGPGASAIHGHPSQDMTVVGVTGTNGKSSTVQLLADIWTQVGERSHVLGTLTNARTTPEGSDLQRQFRSLRDEGIRNVAMEVSSHALSLHRVQGTAFAAAIFTNLGRDHLDFHKTEQAYFEAKAELFTATYTNIAVVNSDDQYGQKLLSSLAGSDIDVHTYSLADASQLTFDGPRSRFIWQDHEIVLQLAGSYNVANALGAATCMNALGVDPADIADALCGTNPVRGRFELVDAGQPFTVAVDYAHTPDALAAALAASRQAAGNNKSRASAAGRVIVVFGCGGDRDRQKRPEMGQVAEGGADLVIVTSDNPRSEDPQAIVDSILTGFSGQDQVIIELDRKAAIHRAVAEAGHNDVVLIAGKGHETDQVIGDQVLPFDDRTVALDALGVTQ